MTDSDLRSEISAMRATLTQIEKQMARAEVSRERSSKEQRVILERVVHLEAKAGMAEDLPKRVAHNEAENAVQDAIRKERTEVLGRVQRTILAGFAIAGSAAGIIGTVVSWALA